MSVAIIVLSITDDMQMIWQKVIGYYGLLTRNTADDATNDVAQATPRNYTARTSNLNSEESI
ncbi:hypothetical protein HK096_007025 [Nowakowskiella sp. JEL0078]|nr:hypothetical protein HK096_007025 [Nowakowskiella sp. JEL0078]